MKTMNIHEKAGTPRQRALPAQLPPLPVPFTRLLGPKNRKPFWQTMSRWNGWHRLTWPLLLAILLLLFIHSGPLLRLLDPAAAVLDAGLLSVLLLALLATLLFGLAARLLLYLVAPAVAGRARESYRRTFQLLSPCQQICVYAASYLGCLFAFVGVFTALL